MRCKNHYTDLTSTIGVCSCCLRERLLCVIAAQEQAQSQSPIQNPHNSDNIPPIHHRKRNQSDGATAWSDNNDRLHHPRSAPHHRRIISDQLFYQTPELDPTSVGNGNGKSSGGYSSKKRSFIRFFSFTNIFRSRNRKSVTVTEPRVSDSVSVSVSDSDSTFRRHYGGGGAVRRRNCRDRGMSPVRNSDTGGDEEESNASTESWRNTPRWTPARRGGGGGGGHSRQLSGLAFCLSPLVRASPNRPEVVFSGEIRVPVKPHLSDTKSFNGNRSRKLADFGRSNLNR
ncbi:hypothetical protein Hdeb2414_s0003g00111171 [Helianthus debilis subsp. tardiflorus]